MILLAILKIYLVIAILMNLPVLVLIFISFLKTVVFRW